MAITVTAIAPTTLLTTVARVKATAGISVSTDDALLDDLVRQASAAIVSYCHRPFAREGYTETLPGFGDIHLMLSRTPIVIVSAVQRDTQIITDYTVANPGQGLLYRRLGFFAGGPGWDWTTQFYGGLAGGGAYLDVGIPLPRQEEPLFSVDYFAGYLLPAQNILSSATLSAAAADQSFNDSANSFTMLLKAGDVIETAGWTNAVNNGRFIVSSVPTSGKIIVSGGTTLVNENAGAGTRSLLVSSLPADIEKAAIEATKTWYIERKDDPNLEEKQVGPMRVRFGARGGNTIFSEPQALPSNCIGLLRPWVRAA